MRYAVLFPGQGAQYAGMANVLRDQFAWTKTIYEEASETLQENLLRLCVEGPEDALQLTRNAQPAILTTSYAWYQVLRRELDFQPAAAAGHSLGEYTALLAAGALTLPEAVRLVRQRGERMQTAVPAGKGKMAALLGLSDEAVKELCGLASKGPSSLVVPANFNAPMQVVIAGHADAVERAEALAQSAEHPHLKAKKVIPLKVSAPFHCPLMKPAADQFEANLKSVAWKPRQLPVAHNLDAVLRQDGDLVPLLRDQIDHPVLWTACMQTLGHHDLATFIEMGPGKVLSGLGKRIVDGAKFVSVESGDDIRKVETLVKESQ